MTHEEAIRALTTYLVGQRIPEENISLAKRHVESCSRCESELEEMTASISVAVPELRIISSLSEELKIVIANDAAGHYGQMPAFRNFAEQWTLENEPAPSLWSAVKEHRKRLVDPIKIAITKGTQTILDLPAGVSFSELAPMPTRSSTGEGGASPILIRIPDESSEREITLSLFSDDAGCVDVNLSLTGGSESKPISGAFVALCDADGSILENDSTSELGHVNFSAVRPGSYLLKVQEQGSEWEIPYEFSS